MAEIWNLNAICRCCHTDGNFKTLNLSYVFNGIIEVYSEMLNNTLNINLSVPTLGASFTICDKCIERLRDATLFKQQVLACESKFEEYIKNELALLPVDIKEEYIGQDEKPDVKQEDTDILKKEKKYEIEIDVPDFPRDDSDNEDDGGDGKTALKSGDAHMSVRAGGGRRDRVGQKSMTRKKIFTKQTKGKIPKNKIEKKLKNKNKLATKVKQEKRMHKCEVCGEAFDKKIDIFHHVEKRHTTPYSCKICNSQFVTYFLLERHIIVHADVKHTCDVCNKSYTSSYGLKSHRNIHTQENVFTCDICKKNFLYKAILRQHLRWHMGTKKKYICQTCGHCCNNNTDLRRHITVVHEKLRLYKCPECSKTFPANKDLKIHLRLHTGERYQCDVCQKVFLALSNLNCHKKIHMRTGPDKNMKAEPALYTCKWCFKAFDHRGLYISHTKTHTEGKTLICELCGKNFSCKYSLRRHLAIHTGMRKFACEACGQQFTTKFQVQRHFEKRHDSVTKELMPKIKCEICNKSVWNIKDHMKTHNDRRFACDSCDKCYSQRNALNRHIKEYHRYGGEKQYECEICSKRYRIKHNLKKHKMKAHKIKDYNQMDSKDGYE